MGGGVQPDLTREVAVLDLLPYLNGHDPALLEFPEGRRALTEMDPLLFALVYLPKAIKAKDTGEISFSRFHLDLVEAAKRWAVQSTKPRQHRDGYIAPRECGKSTWLFKILPLWAAAHGHRRFIAAFADSSTQAQDWLSNFKLELDTNQLLRLDFPALCTPLERSGGYKMADNRAMLRTSSGFVFAAKGVDSAVLGMNIDDVRPDLIICDDVEPSEDNYSAGQKDKRLRTVLDAILPMNERAQVLMVGTVTMPGSIIHDLVKSVTTTEVEDWITDAHFQSHYYPAIITDPETGEEYSIWPEKWPMEYLNSIRRTRSFAKNFMNDPMGIDGEYWTMDDFRYGSVRILTRQVLYIDPAVTTHEKSDYTALAVVGYSAEEKKFVVRDAWQLKIQVGKPLRDKVLSILELYPETAGVAVESNQGGDAWKAILHDLPVSLYTPHARDPKEIRAARLLNRYQLGRVLHEKPLRAAEEQMVSFPKGRHDDLVDAIGGGVETIAPKNKPKAGGRSGSYI